MSFLRTLSRLRQVARNHPPGAVLIPNEAMPEFRQIRNESMSIEEHAEALRRLRREQIAEATRRGEPLPVGGSIERIYYVGTPSVALVAATQKAVAQLATGTTISNTLMGFDFSQDGALNATGGATTFLLQRASTVGTGTSYTANKMQASLDLAAGTTALVNCSATGTLTANTALGWFVPLTSGLSYQFPLGRELTMTISSFLDALGTTQVGVNSLTNLYFAE